LNTTFINTKTWLMIHRPIFQRLLVIGFMVLVGFCLAKGIYSQSVTAVILAIISLTAGIYFVHLLHRANQEAEFEKQTSSR
jgi:disulfide bond formation protein DsbB